MTTEERVPSYEFACGTRGNQGRLIDRLRPSQSTPDAEVLISQARRTKQKETTSCSMAQSRALVGLPLEFRVALPTGDVSFSKR